MKFLSKMMSFFGYNVEELFQVGDYVFGVQKPSIVTKSKK
ncbi:hypothetical protein SIN_0665 [Streptococcus infantis SK1302]|uniref:Uncharacterized protein n=1 Tax=Streptococcus infantis SK1302 TaxID=871237 RepID=A0ABN0B5R5_9STRE|nr:hypothetical protein SIN_0665 [Streptococcus infantis SK1302]